MKTSAWGAALAALAVALLVATPAVAKPRPKRARPKKAVIVAKHQDEPAPPAPPPTAPKVEPAPPAPEPESPKKEEPPMTPTPPPPTDEGDSKLEVGGRVFTYLRTPLSFEEPFQQVSTSLRLEAHARMTKGTFAAIAAQADALTPASSGEVEARARLREAYAGAHAAGFELRIGQQILHWGNADVVHAVDLLTAQDYSFYSADPDARDIGAPSVVLSYSPDDGSSPFKATAVWQPVFPASRLGTPRSPRSKGALPPQVTLLDDERPRLSMLASEAAVKIAWAPGGWDVALIGFHGWNHLAEPYVAKVENGAAVIGRRFHRYEALGAQGSAALGAWVLRFEAAYVITENDDGKDPLVQPSHLDAIAGIERPFGEHVRTSVQGIVRWIPRFASHDTPPRGMRPDLALATRAAGDVNARVQNYTHEARPGASVAVSVSTDDEALEVGASGLAYFVGFDWAVQPNLRWRPTQALAIDVGAQIFGGHRNSLGFLHEQSGLYAQAAYAF